MRYIFLLAVLLVSCSVSNKLPSGPWSGYVSSMDKPESRTTIRYQVDHSQENVSLKILGPRGMNIQTKGLEMTQDSLFFSYDKLDQSGSLSCGMKKVNKNYYYGQCTDTEGKWAVFTMKHYSIDSTSVVHQIGGCPCHK